MRARNRAHRPQLFELLHYRRLFIIGEADRQGLLNNVKPRQGSTVKPEQQVNSADRHSFDGIKFKRLAMRGESLSAITRVMVQRSIIRDIHLATGEHHNCKRILVHDRFPVGVWFLKLSESADLR
jgi:hypothetical protein